MLLLPSFTALLLTLPPLDAPAAWTHEALRPYFPLPSWSEGTLDGGIPPVRPFPVAAVPAVPAPRNPDTPAPGATRPAPLVQPMTRVPTEMTEPLPRPASPLGRRTGAMGSFAADSMAGASSFSLNGDLYLVTHPWFGIIYIQSPGFVVEPGQFIALPWNPPGLPYPVTAAEPGAILLDERVFTIGQPGFVSWIINF